MEHAVPDPLLVILDLDETLFFASETSLDRPADQQVGPYHLYKRPYVDQFVQHVQSRYKVAVWTSAGGDYARAALPLVIPDPEELLFVWSSSRCIRRFDPELHEYYWVKDLKKVKKLGFNLERVLVVDDTPSKHERNYGNLVRVRPFLGDPADDELLHLASFIDALANAPNVRQVEKRRWRDRT